MLVLGRHINEWIVITAPDGTRLYMQVTDIRNGNKVRLGFEMPLDYTIDRWEVDESKRLERELDAG